MPILSSPAASGSKPARDLDPSIPHHDPAVADEDRVRATTSSAAPFLRQLGPDFHHPGPAGWQHAVLHAVQVAAVDRGHEAAGDQAQDDTGREIVFPETVSKLEVLVEHGSEREGNRLYQICQKGNKAYAY